MRPDRLAVMDGEVETFLIEIEGCEREPMVMVIPGLASMKRCRRGISQRLPKVGRVATESDA